MAITRPINNGYSVIMGEVTGSNPENGAIWAEYKVLTQDIVKNTSTIRVYLYLSSAEPSGTWGGSGGYGWITIDEERMTASNIPYDIRGDKVTQFGKLDKTIAHNVDGTAYPIIGGRIKTRSSHVSGGNVAPRAVALPSIPRSGTFYSSNIGQLIVDKDENVCETITIPIERNNKAFRHEVKAQYNNKALFTIHNHLSDSYTITEDNLAAIYSAMDANHITASLELTTYQNDTKIGVVDKAVAMISLSTQGRSPKLNHPIFSVSDTSELATTVTGGAYGVFIKGISNVAVSITGKATATKGAAFGENSVSVSVGESIQRIGNNDIPTTLVFNAATDGNVSAMFTDNRGNASIAHNSYTLLNYTTPELTFTAQRDNNSVGDTVSVVGEIKYHVFEDTPNNNRIIACRLRYRATNDSQWNTPISIAYEDNNSGIATFDVALADKFDIDKSYAIEVYATDSLNSHTMHAETITSTSVTLDINGDTRSVSIGRTLSGDMPDGSLEIEGGLKLSSSAAQGLGITPYFQRHINNGMFISTSIGDDKDTLFLFEITGNSYATARPIHLVIQGYFYKPANEIIQFTSAGLSWKPEVTVGFYMGDLRLWIPPPHNNAGMAFVYCKSQHTGAMNVVVSSENIGKPSNLNRTKTTQTI